MTTPKELVGRRVKIVAQECLDFMTYYLRRTQHPSSPEGTVTHVEGFGDGGDVWVRIEGLTREYVFGLYQLDVLPLVGEYGS